MYKEERLYFLYVSVSHIKATHCFSLQMALSRAAVSLIRPKWNLRGHDGRSNLTVSKPSPHQTPFPVLKETPRCRILMTTWSNAAGFSQTTNRNFLNLFCLSTCAWNNIRVEYWEGCVVFIPEGNSSPFETRLEQAFFLSTVMIIVLSLIMLNTFIVRLIFLVMALKWQLKMVKLLLF